MSAQEAASTELVLRAPQVDCSDVLQSDCAFLAFLEEPIKSIMSYKPTQALSAGPGQSTQIPPWQKVTPMHLDLTNVLTARLIALAVPPHRKV